MLDIEVDCCIKYGGG